MDVQLKLFGIRKRWTYANAIKNNVLIGFSQLNEKQMKKSEI